MAQRKRAGLITRRTADRNRPLLYFFAIFDVLIAQEFALSRSFDFGCFATRMFWGKILKIGASEVERQLNLVKWELGR